MISSQPFETEALLKESGVSTVCASALCPNQNECYSKKTATFLILGETCTRACGFCSVGKGAPFAPDPQEPRRIAELVRRMALRYAVITSVTRDDLEDGGSSQFIKVIEAVRSLSPDTKIEVLTPDFMGDSRAIRTVLSASPDVFGHNIETVRQLYPAARKGADYDTSMGIMKLVKEITPSQLTKSALLVGLGESQGEVVETMRDLRAAACDMLVIGQYLRPRKSNLPVVRFLGQEEFDRYRKIGEEMGFCHVASGPFVRSSYKAEEIYNILK